MGELKIMKGAAVWVRNPFPEAEATIHEGLYGPPPFDACTKYRKQWLPKNVSLRPVWIPGQVIVTAIEHPEGLIVVQTSIGEVQMKVTTSEIDVMARDLTIAHYENSMEMKYDNEAELLWNTQKRLTRDQPFTMCGDNAIISCNPFKEININNNGPWKKLCKELYSRHLQHCCTTLILRSISATFKPTSTYLQNCVYSTVQCFGEKGQISSNCDALHGATGSGKTILSKAVIDFLVTSTSASTRSNCPDFVKNVFNKDDTKMSLIEQRLLSIHTVLEAFTNTWTTRNQDTSHMGKLVKLYFGSDKHLQAAEIIPSLLDRSRLLNFPERERNYNIFYMLIAGSTSKDLELRSTLDYKLLWGGNPESATSTVQIESSTDSDNFDRLKSALSIFGINEATQSEIFQIIAGLLSLAEITFHQGQIILDGKVSGSPLTAVHAKHAEALSHAAKMFGVSLKDLEDCMCMKMSKQGNVFVSATAIEAVNIRNMLITNIYAGLVSSLITKMNQSMQENLPETFDLRKNLWIGIFDLPGIDASSQTEHNNLEQLLKNVTAEKIHSIVHRKLFKEEEEQCVSQGIEVPKCSYNDNTKIVETFLGGRNGFLSAVNNAARYPDTDQSFLKIQLRNFDILQSMPCQYTDDMTHEEQVEEMNRAHTSMGVKHSNGQHIRYNTNGWLESIRNYFVASQNESITISELLEDSTLTILRNQIRKEMNLVPNEKSRFSKQDTLIKVYQSTHKKLFRDTKLESRNHAGEDDSSYYIDCHFCFCIRPNLTKLFNFVSPNLLNNQLCSVGAHSMIQRRFTGYHYRVEYPKFIVRFLPIVAKNQFLKWPPQEGVSIKALSCELLRVLLLMLHKDLEDYEDDCKAGPSMIFIRFNVMSMLEKLRAIWHKHSHESAYLIQTTWRNYLGDKRLKEIKLGVERMQASFRSMYYSSLWKQRRKAARVIDECAKTHLVSSSFHNIRRAAIITQRFYKKRRQRFKWLKMRRGLRVMHSLARGFVVRQHVLRMLYAVRTIQRAVRAWLMRYTSYWKKVKLSLMIQCHFRGKLYREGHTDIMAWLGKKDLRRQKIASVKMIEDNWKILLVRRRYYEITQASLCIQHWFRALKVRNFFINANSSIKNIQRIVRGNLARKKVESMRSFNMVCDEMWRLKTVRERESMQMYKVSLQVPPESTEEFHRMIDTDMMIDVSDCYPSGWSCIMGQFDEDMVDENRHIVQVCVGASHSCVLDNEGKVYTWGWGDYGQLGHGIMGNEGIPRQIRSLTSIKKISCGEDHSLALDSSGSAYSWGSNLRGQLGLGELNRGQRDVNQPTKVDIPHRVVDIATGSFHSLAVALNGGVYSWGSGEQLGIGVFTGRGDRNLPCLINSLRRFRISRAAAGPTFSAVITQRGSVYTWGSGEYGQLGQGGTKRRLVPQAIEGFGGSGNGERRVEAIACGGQHMVALTTSGHVYSWGTGHDGTRNTGQLGIGGQTQALIPTLVSRMKMWKVTQIACGYRHTLVITQNNRIFGWGLLGCIKGFTERLSNNKNFDLTQYVSLYPTEMNFGTQTRGVWPKLIHADYSHTLSVSGVVYSSISNKATKSKVSKQFEMLKSGALGKLNSIAQKRIKAIRELLNDFDGALVMSDNVHDMGWVAIYVVDNNLANTISRSRGTFSLQTEMKKRGIHCLRDRLLKVNSPHIVPLMDLKDMNAFQLRSIVQTLQGNDEIRVNRKNTDDQRIKKLSLSLESKVRSEMLRDQQELVAPPPAMRQYDEFPERTRSIITPALRKAAMQRQRKMKKANNSVKKVVKYQSNIDVNSLFTPEQLVTTSNDQLSMQLDSTGHATIGYNRYPAYNKRVASRGLTVSEMISQAYESDDDEIPPPPPH